MATRFGLVLRTATGKVLVINRTWDLRRDALDWAMKDATADSACEKVKRNRSSVEAFYFASDAQPCERYTVIPLRDAGKPALKEIP